MAYREAVRLTTETGSEVFLGFVATPPAEWLQINGPNAIVLLERTQFDRIHHLVQSESPLFVTTMQGFFGPVFNLSTSPELPGEGPPTTMHSSSWPPSSVPADCGGAQLG